jgi:hypothetical protein
MLLEEVAGLLTSFYTESLQPADFQCFALPIYGFSAIFASY